MVTNAAESGTSEDQADASAERESLIDYIKECQDKFRVKSELRASNECSDYTDAEEIIQGLDCGVKKNCAFVKKLRNMTEGQKESLIKDMLSLNLSKYISEVAGALVEAKLKMSDIPMAIKICSLLHQRYSDFSSQLLESWNKSLPKKPTDLANLNLSKMRIDIRFFAELITSGIFTLKEGLPILGNLLTLLVTSDKDNHNNINIILTFCRHCGDDYAGLTPRKMRLLSEKYDVALSKSDFLPCDRQRGLRNLLKDYYKTLAVHIVRDHKSLQSLERQNRRTLISKGELSDKRKEKFEQAQVAFQKLWSASQQLADILDEDLPELPPDTPDSFDDMDESIINLDTTNRFKTSQELDASALWEDEDTRSFYEDVPDLKSLVPSILYKDSAKDGIKDRKEAPVQDKITKDDEGRIEDSGTPVVGLMETVLEENEEENLTIDSEDETVSNINEEEVNGTLTDEDSSKDAGQNEKDEKQTEEIKLAQPSPANKVVLEAFLTSLLSCVNRDMIDKAALNFCTNLNTKYTRKKLVRALFTVPRTRLDLLPFYSRLVATLSPVMPHVATDLVQLLKQDFKFHIRKKDQINIESKVKNVRFIGELVKFKIFPKSEALTCLRLLLNDFVHHHIEMACNLLETCGRYLFRSADSHHRCKLLLEQMMRKKSLLPYDSRYITTIENAYYFANPPETQTISRHERPPMHEYIRKLLYKDLCRTNMDKILILIRKLDWDNPEIASYVIKCFISVWNVRFYNIRCVANLLAALIPYQDWVIPQVIDGVMEDIRLMMEINHPKYNQRRISIMRFVGEMYNYRLIESNVVFKILYTLITYGIYYNTPEVFSEIDSPDNLFRIRLICQVLETCGQYFNSGSSKKKLDCFIIVFQKYYWLKKSQEFYTDEYPFPVNVEILFKDTINALRPKFKCAETLEDANNEVEKIFNELRPKLCELFPSLEADTKTATENVGGEEDDKRLNSIVEVDEDLDSECNLPDMDEESDDDNNSDNEPDRGSGDQGIKNRSSNLTGTDEGSDTEGERERSMMNERSMPPKLVECPEDDLFRKEFDRIMSESLISRGQEAVRGTLNDIVIPMNKLVAAKKSVAFSELGPTVSSKMDDDGNSDKFGNPETATLNLMVMTRAKGNKPLLKPVQVPIDSDLALSLKQKEEAERAEKQQVKKLTLHINERREMEETMTDKSNPMLVINFNRDSRRKYQHPKGAPDIDLIFGNK